MFWLPAFPPPPELEPVDAGGGGGVKLGVNAGSVRDVKVDDDMVAVGQAQEVVTRERPRDKVRPADEGLGRGPGMAARPALKCETRRLGVVSITSALVSLAHS